MVVTTVVILQMSAIAFRSTAFRGHDDDDLAAKINNFLEKKRTALPQALVKALEKKAEEMLKRPAAKKQKT
jgi:DNA-binding SARP family transcriptional activator